MAELIIRDMERGVLRQIERRAKSNGRTPAEEAIAILSDAVGASNRADANAWSGVDAVYSRLAMTGKLHADSVALLREDRDR